MLLTTGGWRLRRFIAGVRRALSSGTASVREPVAWLSNDAADCRAGTGGSSGVDSGLIEITCAGGASGPFAGRILYRDTRTQRNAGDTRLISSAVNGRQFWKGSTLSGIETEDSTGALRGQFPELHRGGESGKVWQRLSEDGW
jgi:hypothetical protein